jgi:hypothetical protein
MRTAGYLALGVVASAVLTQAGVPGFGVVKIILLFGLIGQLVYTLGCGIRWLIDRSRRRTVVDNIRSHR